MRIPPILLTVKLHCPSPSTRSPSSTILLLFWRLFLRQTSQPLWWQNEAHSSYWKLEKKHTKWPYSPGLLQGGNGTHSTATGDGLLCRQALSHLLCGQSDTEGHRLRRRKSNSTVPQTYPPTPQRRPNAVSASTCPHPVLKHSCTDRKGEGREAPLAVTSLFPSSTHLPHFLALKFTTVKCTD